MRGSRHDLPEIYLSRAAKNVAYLRDSGLFDGALAVGEPLPPFRLQNASGRFIDSPDLLAKGPLVSASFARLVPLLLPT